MCVRARARFHALLELVATNAAAAGETASLRWGSRWTLARISAVFFSRSFFFVFFFLHGRITRSLN